MPLSNRTTRATRGHLRPRHSSRSGNQSPEPHPDEHRGHKRERHANDVREPRHTAELDTLWRWVGHELLEALFHLLSRRTEGMGNLPRLPSAPSASGELDRPCLITAACAT